MAHLKKKWPERNELLSWWILHKIQNSPMHDLDDPEMIEQWLIEFHQLSLHGAHLELYAKYQNFRNEYVHPRYAGYAGSYNNT